MEACRRLCAKSVKILLEAGADVNVKMKSTGFTCLHHLADFVRNNSSTYQNLTPPQLAKAKKIVHLLRNAGVDTKALVVDNRVQRYARSLLKGTVYSELISLD